MDPLKQLLHTNQRYISTYAEMKILKTDHTVELEKKISGSDDTLIIVFEMFKGLKIFIGTQTVLWE